MQVLESQTDVCMHLAVIAMTPSLCQILFTSVILLDPQSTLFHVIYFGPAIYFPSLSQGCKVHKQGLRTMHMPLHLA